MRHQAIYDNYPNVVRVVDKAGGQDCYDASGNIVTIDQGLVDNSVAVLNLNSVYRDKIKEISDWQTAQFKEFDERYPEAEQRTWPIQAEEARAFEASSSAATPYIDALIGNRGKAKRDFVESILSNDIKYQAVSVAANAAAQDLREQADAALENEDLAAIQAIQVPT